MLDWLKRNWAPLAGGLVVGTVATLAVQNARATEQKKALPAGPTPEPSPSPATPQGPAVIVLLPGVTQVQAASGDTLSVGLPQGATWLAANLASGQTLTSLGPDANGVITFTVPPAVTSFVARWQDSSGVRYSILALVQPGQTAIAPVTDASAVGEAQAMVANAASQNVIAGLTYPAGGQTFQAALALVQAYINANSKAGSDIQLRTDGVLDYATFAALSMS